MLGDVSTMKIKNKNENLKKFLPGNTPVRAALFWALVFMEIKS